MLRKILMFGMVLSFSTMVFAGECKIKVDREPCPGKKEETFKPYDGKNPTEETKTVEKLDQCLAFAEKASKIVRKGTLAKKTVTGTFDGADLKKTFSDTSVCK